MEVAHTHEPWSVIRLIISLPIIVCGLLVVIALMLWIVIAAREMMVVMVVMVVKVVRVMPDSLVGNCFFISFVLLSVCSPIRLADFYFFYSLPENGCKDNTNKQ